MWKVTSMIERFSNATILGSTGCQPVLRGSLPRSLRCVHKFSSHKCVRQAAGQNRLAACAPQNFRTARTGKQQQWPTLLLPRSSSDRKSHAERFEPAPQHVVMLLGQNLGWRHESGLKTGLHREQNCRDGDDRFPGADVTLQQTIHRVGRGEIAPNLRDDFRLRSSQLERQPAQKLLQ